MNIVEIKSGDWKLEIDLNGGRIKKLSYKDKIILGTFERIDGKMANTHVCVPNFGDEGKDKGLIFHGPFRNMEWKVEKQNDGELIICCENEGLKVEQKFTLGENFSHKIRVTNISNEKQTVNIASHNYWQVDDNWKEMKIDGVVVNKIIEADDWYEAKEKQALEFDNKKIEWELKGYNKLRLWAGRKENELGEKIFDQKYICIEPVIDKEGSDLMPGESREVEQVIGVVYRT